MKYRTLVYLLFVSVFLSSCARGCQKFKRGTTGKRDYYIVVFSGGDTVFTDYLKNDILTEEEGNGMYYYKGDTLIEVSGDYIIKSVN